MNEPTPEKEIKQMWRDYRFFYRMLLYAALIGVGVLIGRAIYAAPEADQAWGYGVNLFTGVLSTAATVLILDQLAERRANRKAEEALKEQLKMDAASISNEVAKNAVHQLWRKGWLESENGLLKGADLRRANLHNVVLWRANLQGADLSEADFQEADLRWVNLQEADLRWINLNKAILRESNLQGADLSEADLAEADLEKANLQEAKLYEVYLQAANLKETNLQDASLIDANLQGAKLRWANLQGANLRGASLQGASLYEADLQGAKLENAFFDEKTRLPDERFWTPEADLQRFIDPNHPQFWRSEHQLSPAYRGRRVK